MHDIFIMIAASCGTAMVLALCIVLARVWRLPKRTDRLERVVPVLGRGVWALLAIHIKETNGDADPAVISSYDECTKTFTDGVVSQRMNK